MMMKILRKALRHVVAASIAGSIATGVLLTAPANAQMRMGMGPGGDPFSAAISTREFDKLAAMLALSPEQLDAAKTLHTAYKEEHSQVAKAMRDAMNEAQQEFMESKDPNVFKDASEGMKKDQAKQKSLEEGFLNDLKALLDPKQTEQWPKIERYLRRSKSLPNGMLAGESVNLITIVDDLKFEGERPKDLQDAIESYEIDLDRAMTDRDAVREKFQKEQEESMKDFDFSKIDFGAIKKMMAEVRKSGIKVRDANERHTRLIAGILPADPQKDFNDRVRKATYPQIFKETYTSKALGSAASFDDLTAEQTSSIAQMKETFAREITAANLKWAAAIAEEEKDGGGDPFMGFGKMMPGMGSDEKSPTEEAQKARREIDKAALKSLKTLLTEDQQARLPKREEDNPWGMNMGGGAGGSDAEEVPTKPTRDRKKN